MIDSSVFYTFDGPKDMRNARLCYSNPPTAMLCIPSSMHAYHQNSMQD